MYDVFLSIVQNIIQGYLFYIKSDNSKDDYFPSIQFVISASIGFTDEGKYFTK